MEELKELFGSNLRAARLNAGMTQVDLAARSGIQQQDISEIERGSIARNPTIETMWRLAKAAGTTVQALLSESEE